MPLLKQQQLQREKYVPHIYVDNVSFIKAARYAIKMAQSASLAESKAMQARQNLENYVFGTAVSTVPPVIPPMLPRGAASYPAYPYVSSPAQWNQGVPPIANATFGVDSLNIMELSSRFQRHKSTRLVLDFL